MSSAEPTPALTKECKEEMHKQAVGVANFEAARAKAGGLSALGKTEAGKKWFRALVPKYDEEGANLNIKLNEYVDNPVLMKKNYADFSDLLKSTKKFYNEKRVKVYESVLTDETHGEEARQQLCTLAGKLDDTFKRGYANIFETWIEVGDKKGLDRWTNFANGEIDRLNANEEKMAQDVTDMGKLYKDACNGELIEVYEAFFTKVAAETGGVFIPAKMKSPLRATEKTAFRHDPDRRFKCDNVYDVLRGAIEYPDMNSFTDGGEVICSSKEFTALKLKDRITKGRETSSGWRDAMINGIFEATDTHVVEIQLHHKKLVSIREDLGGHYLYSIYRSIIESLEVVFGEKRTQEMIEEHASTKVNNGEQSGEALTLRDENRRLASENKELKTDNSKLTSDISELNTHNSKLTMENKELKTEIDKLRKQMHDQQGSSSSDQWHVVLLNWFREFTDENKHAERFEPRYPKSKEDLLALTKINLSGCNLEGPIPKELGQLQKLTHLDLSNNRLTDTQQFKDYMKQQRSGCSVSV